MRFNLKDCSDVELVELYTQKNNREAFGEIFERYFEPTYKFVFSRVGNKTWSEEIVSETFTTLLQVISSFNKTSQLKSFIIGIALNKTRQFWAQKYKENESELNENYVILDEVDESDENKINDISKIINLVLEDLPENYKSVLQERFINNRNIKETAEVLSISEGNVRVLQNRALKKAAEIGSKYLNEK